jgi:hypothetical protein
LSSKVLYVWMRTCICGLGDHCGEKEDESVARIPFHDPVLFVLPGISLHLLICLSQFCAFCKYLLKSQPLYDLLPMNHVKLIILNSDIIASYSHPSYGIHQIEFYLYFYKYSPFHCEFLNGSHLVRLSIASSRECITPAI